MIHELKIYPTYFEKVKSNEKRFEVRKNDRNFKVGDCLILKEYNLYKEQYTGEIITRKVDYILQGGQFGIEKEYCIMSISEPTPSVI